MGSCPSAASPGPHCWDEKSDWIRVTWLTKDRKQHTAAVRAQHGANLLCGCLSSSIWAAMDLRCTYGNHLQRLSHMKEEVQHQTGHCLWPQSDSSKQKECGLGFGLISCRSERDKAGRSCRHSGLSSARCCIPKSHLHCENRAPGLSSSSVRVRAPKERRPAAGAEQH